MGRKVVANSHHMTIFALGFLGLYFWPGPRKAGRVFFMPTKKADAVWHRPGG